MTIVAVRICGKYKARSRFQTSSRIIGLFADPKASVFLFVSGERFQSPDLQIFKFSNLRSLKNSPNASNLF